MHVKYLAYMPSLGGIIGSGLCLAITAEVEVAVSYALAYMQKCWVNMPM